jgi:hypothetical protein
MSLKVFHIFFITLAILLCLGFGAWCLRQPGYLAFGIGSFVAAGGLIGYEIFIVR